MNPNNYNNYNTPNSNILKTPIDSYQPNHIYNPNYNTDSNYYFTPNYTTPTYTSPTYTSPTYTPPTYTPPTYTPPTYTLPPTYNTHRPPQPTFPQSTSHNVNTCDCCQYEKLSNTELINIINNSTNYDEIQTAHKELDLRTPKCKLCALI